jgi:hypothetical protein
MSRRIADAYQPMILDASLSSPNVDIVSQFVSLVTAASAPIAPPVAIFVHWLSSAVLENMYASLPICKIRYLSMMARPSVQRLLVAYTVDFISVLRELFDLTLQPDKARATTWQELREAFEAYKRSPSCQHIHNSICSKSAQGEQIVTADDIREKIRGKYL